MIIIIQQKNQGWTDENGLKLRTHHTHYHQNTRQHEWEFRIDHTWLIFTIDEIYSSIYHTFIFSFIHSIIEDAKNKACKKQAWWIWIFFFLLKIFPFGTARHHYYYENVLFSLLIQDQLNNKDLCTICMHIVTL